MGYVRTGSIPSITAGCTVGALVRFFFLLTSRSKHLWTDVDLLQYALGGYRIQNKQPYGVELALLASLVLVGSSLPRAIKTQKPLPIGLSALAAFGLYNFGMAYRNNVSGR